MKKKGLGFLGIFFLVAGLVALYFIYKTGLVWEFITFIRGFF